MCNKCVRKLTTCFISSHLKKKKKNQRSAFRAGKDWTVLSKGPNSFLSEYRAKGNLSKQLANFERNV